MRTRGGKHSEAFWPSSMVKKLFKIKPQVCDFVEEDLDTESEDESCLNLSGLLLKDYAFKFRRGSSEMLHLEYVENREIRVAIGTWNVAGRLPSEALDIGNWLDVKESADIYVVGFQEIVALNARNVLGAEDCSPIPKWEAIICKTLNRTHQRQTRCRSCSAPPSPVSCVSSAADALDVDIPEKGFARSNCDLKPFNPFDVKTLGIFGSFNDNFRSKASVDHVEDNRLYWPEHLPDASVLSLSANTNKRVFNSSRMLASPKLDKKLGFDSQGVKFKGNMKRVHHSSGDLGSICPEQDDTLLTATRNLPRVSNTRVTGGFLRDHFSTFEEHHRIRATKRRCKIEQDRYVCIVSKQMVGIYVSIWVHQGLRRHIKDIKVSTVGVGLMGYMGNKGSVSVSMSLFQTRLCFVCSHLSSGQKDGTQERRNHDVRKILRRTRFSTAVDSGQLQTILSHDQIFWFGDLNYRLNIDDKGIRELVAKSQWHELIHSDQLCAELRRGHVFNGWKEGLIDFAPTYKYELYSDKYAWENAKQGIKHRSPAWCDRILWFGKGIKQLSYRRSELSLSDHRPVRSTFLLNVEIFNHGKLKLLNVSNAG